MAISIVDLRSTAGISRLDVTDNAKLSSRLAATGRAVIQSTCQVQVSADEGFADLDGKFTDDQRKGVFKPEVAVDGDASAQDRLLAYTGRSPA